jgi:hypothetical protein
MTPPSLLSQCLGYPPITFTLLALYTLLLGAWYADEVPFVLGFLVVLAVRKTMKAYDHKREFKDYALILAAGEDDEAILRLPPPCRAYAGVAVRNAVALVALHVSSVYLPQVPDTEPAADVLQGVWWLAALYLMWTVGRVTWRIWQRFKKPVTAPLPAPAELEDDTVIWMLGRPENAPSRAMAESELPDYCVGLIQRGD